MVEGRKSGDIWLSNGDAVEGKTKFGRAIGILAPTPKLSVLPPEECGNDGQLVPWLQIQMDDSAPNIVGPIPQSPNNAESGEMSMASFQNFADDESILNETNIAVAQKHHLQIALGVKAPASTEYGPSLASAAGTVEQPTKSYLRVRSVSSPILTPTSPPSALPPTSTILQNARCAKLGHKKALSTGAFLLNALDVNEIDSMTAGLLPLLVPGLKVGSEMKIRRRISSSGLNSKANQRLPSESVFVTECEKFESPELHSTPPKAWAWKISGHMRAHDYLPR